MMSWLLQKILMFGGNEIRNNLSWNVCCREIYIFFMYLARWYKTWPTHTNNLYFIMYFLSFLCVIHLCLLSHDTFNLFTGDVLFSMLQTISIHFYFMIEFSMCMVSSRKQIVKEWIFAWFGCVYLTSSLLGNKIYLLVYYLSWWSI
jgi:hypothetical protein